MSLFMLLISSLVINVAEVVCAYRIINKKINFKSKRLYCVYILLVLLIFMNFIFAANIYKVLISFLIMILIFKLLFKLSLNKCFVGAVILEILTILSEFIFAIIVVVFRNISTSLFAILYEGTVIANIAISGILILLSLKLNINKIYNKLLKITSGIAKNKLIIFFSFVILCSSFLFYISYYNKSNFFTLIVNFVIVTVYFLIVVLIINKESKYNKINAKYKTTLEELSQYESIINEYKIMNHENKNQLSTLKGLTTNKKVRTYIDEILNTKVKDNEAILTQSLLIPTGGLRGLIYSKLVVMKNKKIDYKLNVDKEINSKLISNISTKTMLNVCQIIGVFLDNAIEEIEGYSSNNKKILINIYKDNDIVIEVINNLKSNIDLNVIDKAGYTTKKGGHGYGLSLVNKLIKQDSNLLNEKEITKNTFKQKLIIKVK